MPVSASEIRFLCQQDDERDDVYHVLMVQPTPHDLNGFRCWCAPKLSTICGQCDGDGCWKCHNGWRGITLKEAEAERVPTLAIHSP